MFGGSLEKASLAKYPVFDCERHRRVVHVSDPLSNPRAWPSCLGEHGHIISGHKYQSNWADLWWNEEHQLSGRSLGEESGPIGVFFPNLLSLLLVSNGTGGGLASAPKQKQNVRKAWPLFLGRAAHFSIPIHGFQPEGPVWGLAALGRSGHLRLLLINIHSNIHLIPIELAV